METKKKAKKQLTVKQKKNRYRVAQYSTFAGEFVSILTPFIVMGIANYDTWFKNNPSSWKVGLGGALALALMGLAVFLVAKKKENKEITGGYIALTIGWFAVAFIFMLLGSIIDQISTIMFFGGLGLLGAMGLDIASKQFKNKADIYKKAIEKVMGETLEDKIKEEVTREANNRVPID